MKYEFKSEDAEALARFLGAQTRENGEEMQFLYCPYCHGGEHKDKYTFALNRQNGKFNCMRASCQKQGQFVTLAREMGFALDFGFPKKEYRRLPQREIALRPAAERALAKRGIGPEVCRRYKITTQKNNRNILVFPFYNERGELVTVKYRNANYKKGVDKNKEWFEAGTEPILFGMSEARDYTKPLVITEGQIDALSLAECGVLNAVSVPNGCASFTWIAACYDWVMNFPQITVMGDCENGKLTLLDKISKSFPLPVYCVPPESYYGLKDANDILRQYGKDVLLDAFHSAREYILPHICRLADVESVDFSTLPRIQSGIPQLDDALGGFFYGQVVLLTGRRGEGKSTLMGQLMLEAIDQGNRVLAYSGELTASHFKNWIDFQAAGADGVMNVGSEERPRYILKPEVQEKINDWYRPSAFLYDNEAVEGDELTSILDTIESAVVRYGIHMVCIDNLMTAMDMSRGDDFYRAQSAFVQKLKRMAVRYNIVVLLVAHPRKELSGKLDNDSVAGSGDITNRVDTVLIYSRDDTVKDGISRSTLRLTKNRQNGKLLIDRPIHLVYSESSKRITPLDSPRQKHYGWESPPDWQQAPLEDLPF
nr:MAG TPA: DNA directed DNA polymerase [Caudoviricetes sp.]